MKVIFCNISWMQYYRGIINIVHDGTSEGIDVPKNGGSWVDITGNAHERYNFNKIELRNGQDVCLGAVESMQRNGKDCKLQLENIEGISESAQQAEDVLVVWCAKYDGDHTEKNRTTVVGWYKNATVYREYQSPDGWYYNVKAKAEDCTLLPIEERSLGKWTVNRSKQSGTYGFGQHQVWYARESEAQSFVKDIVEQIENYNGINLMDENV